MIHRLRVENFFSIRDGIDLDLRLPETAPDLPRFRRSEADTSIRVPTVVALFGANASGKTSILRALTAAMLFAAESFALTSDDPLRELFSPFRSKLYQHRPTVLEIDFDAQWGTRDIARVFRYTLEIERDQGLTTIAREHLRVRRGARFVRVFSRDKAGIVVADEIGLRTNDARLEAVRPNASVIATLAALNIQFFQEAADDIRLVQKNVVGLHHMPFDAARAVQYLAGNEEARRHAEMELRRLDVGIDELSFQLGSNGPMLVLTHEGLDEPLFLAEESQGTRHFLAMFPSIFFTLATGRPAIVDEFDANLHPHFAQEIVRWFHDQSKNQYGAQLFVAAHGPALMDDLEKEEIVLVEKGRDGATSALPLRNVRGVRREPSLMRKYLGGAFGAIPNVG